MARDPFGTRLRSLRENAGMSLSRLAEEVGTDQGTLAQWERNLAVPEYATVEQLAIALGISAPGLLIGDLSRPPKR